MATKKMPRRLVALSSSAIASIYFAGLLSTRAAADGLAAEATAPTSVATPANTGSSAAAVAPSVVVGARGTRRGSPGAPAAPASPSAPATNTPSTTSSTTAASTSSSYRDGTYSGTGTSRFGTVSVSVNVSGGQIANVQITRVTTSYPVSRIASLPNAVVKAQSANVNVISGATYSSQAFRQAVQQALTQASA